MANSIIEGRYKKFTLQNALNFQRWNAYCIKDYESGTVKINITAYNPSQITGTRITTVPTECLPKNSELLAGFTATATNNLFAGCLSLNKATGNITSTASSVIMQASISAEYEYAQ